MLNILIHPGIFLILLSLIYDLLAKNTARLLAVLSPFVAYALFYFRMNNGYFDFLFYYQANSFAFVTAFLIILLVGILFALSNNVDKNNDIKFALLYAGSSLSIFLTDNLFIVYILLEIMLVAATFLIFNGRNKLSIIIGTTYFKMHIIVGILFLIGIITHYLLQGKLNIARYDLHDFSSPQVIIAHFCILSALLINLALPPFSYWLTEGYSAASPVGSVFLSVYTTKVSVFLLYKIFVGNKDLMFIGIFMSFYGIFYAILENNLRRIINFNIISQLGLIIIAIAIGDEASKDSAVLMAFNGIFYIALAMMCAGAVIMIMKQKRYGNIDFIANKMEFVFICSIIAFMSVATLPFSPGYVGKYFLYQSDYVIDHKWLKYTITAIAAGMMFSTAIKFPVFVFLYNFSKLRETKKNKIIPDDYSLPMTAMLALFILAFCCIAIGILPERLLNVHIPLFADLAVDYLFLFLGVLSGFVLSHRLIIYIDKATLVDFDWFYRYLLYRVYKLICFIISVLNDFWLRNRDKFSEYTNRLTHSMFGNYGVFAYSKSHKYFIIIITSLLIFLLLHV